MEKFSFLDHVFEIIRVAEELPTNIGEAWDRFRADVRSGKANEYNTGDTLEYFNFERAGEQWNAMTEAEKEAAIEEWQRVMQEDGVYKRKLVLSLINEYREWKRTWTF